MRMNKSVSLHMRFIILNTYVRKGALTNFSGDYGQLVHTGSGAPRRRCLHAVRMGISFNQVLNIYSGTFLHAWSDT